MVAGTATHEKVNVAAINKGNERYMWVFKPETVNQTLQHVNKTALDPKLSFNWYDAAVLSHQIRSTL